MGIEFCLFVFFLFWVRSDVARVEIGWKKGTKRRDVPKPREERNKREKNSQMGTVRLNISQATFFISTRPSYRTFCSTANWTIFYSVKLHLSGQREKKKHEQNLIHNHSSSLTKRFRFVSFFPSLNSEKDFIDRVPSVRVRYLYFITPKDAWFGSQRHEKTRSNLYYELRTKKKLFRMLTFNWIHVSAIYHLTLSISI